MFDKLASEYLERGIAVIPVKPRSKMPAMEAWQSKLITEDEFEKYQHCGISLLCGFTTQELPYGIVALDWDQVEYGIDGNELSADGYQRWLESMYGVPRSPVHKKGKKGLTQFYLGSRDLKTMRRPGFFDFLAQGSHTILPPSIHDSGIAYRWTSQETLTSIDLNDLPTISNIIIENLRNQFGKSTPLKDGTLVTGRNNALYAALAGMFGEGITDLEVLTTRILEFDLQQHPGNPYFSDLSEAQNQSKDARENALQFVLVRYRDLVSKNIRERKPVELLNVTRFVESLEPVVEPEPVKKSYVAPPKLHPYLEDLATDAAKSLETECHMVSQIFAMVAVGTIASNLVYTEMLGHQTFSNLYVLGLLSSGEGKTTLLNYYQEILSQVNGGKLLLKSVLSTNALGSMLATEREGVIMQDEWIGELQEMVISGSPKHSLQMRYATFFSVGGKLKKGENGKTAGTSTDDVYSPCLSLGVMAQYHSFLSLDYGNLLEQGILGRFLYGFPTEIDKEPDYGPAKRDYIADMQKLYDALHGITGTHKYVKNAKVLNIKPEILAYLHEIKLRWKKLKNQAKEQKSDMMSIYNRAFEIFTKMLIVDVCCEIVVNPEQGLYVDNIEQVKRIEEWVDYHLECCRLIFDEEKLPKFEQYLLDRIIDAGSEGIEYRKLYKSKLVQKTPNGVKKCGDAINFLINQSYIAKIPFGKTFKLIKKI